MKYGIICAMEEEIKELINHLSYKNEEKIAGIVFYVGKISGYDIVLVKSGIGKVQSGIVTTLLINKFDIDYVINTGSAGAIDSKLKIGDIVISTGTAYYDVDVTSFGYKLGQLPNHPQIFKSDKFLLNNLNITLNKLHIPVYNGLIVTGDRFINSKSDIQKIKSNYPTALCCEMEGASIGQTAYQFNIPYLVIRAISDTADENSSVIFDKFIIDAGKKSAEVMLNFLRENDL